MERENKSVRPFPTGGKLEFSCIIVYVARDKDEVAFGIRAKSNQRLTPTDTTEED
jgi:hypothetical protein